MKKKSKIKPFSFTYTCENNDEITVSEGENFGEYDVLLKSRGLCRRFNITLEELDAVNFVIKSFLLDPIILTN